MADLASLTDAIAAGDRVTAVRLTQEAVAEGRSRATCTISRRPPSSPLQSVPTATPPDAATAVDVARKVLDRPSLTVRMVSTPCPR